MSKKDKNKKDDFIMDNGADLSAEELQDVSGGVRIKWTAVTLDYSESSERRETPTLSAEDELIRSSLR